MSKRLQVVVGDEELERYARTSQAAGLTLSEWARQALRTAQLESSSGNVADKLELIRRAAASHAFPAPDIDTILAETEAGYLAEIEEAFVPADES